MGRTPAYLAPVSLQGRGGSLRREHRAGTCGFGCLYRGANGVSSGFCVYVDPYIMQYTCAVLICNINLCILIDGMFSAPGYLF